MEPLIPSVDAVTAYLRRMDSARLYSNRGPLVTQFERRLGEELFCVDPSCVVLCASGTVGIAGACIVLGIRDADVPAFTFPATPLAVLQGGGRVHMHDIDPQTWLMVSPAAGVGTRDGSVPVLPFGMPLDFGRFSAGQSVVIDAAASIGASPDLDGLPATWAVVYSLHATKVLGIGEGGVVVFGSVAAASHFRSWINFGFAGTRESQIAGTNGKMSEVAAAYGLAALDSWPRERVEWMRARAMANAVSVHLGLAPKALERIEASPYWIVDLGSAESCRVVEAVLAEAGIETRRWWSAGCHRMPAFASDDQSFPVTDVVAARTLGLPMSRTLTQANFDRIEHELHRALELSAVDSFGDCRAADHS